MTARREPWDRDEAAWDRAGALLEQMTLEEKIELVTGDLGDWRVI